IKNCAEQLPEPQITGNSPAICLRVINPSVPQFGHDSTAQYGSSCSPTLPAFSSTKIVPGIICSGIHSLRTSSAATIAPPLVRSDSGYEALFLVRERLAPTDVLPFLLL